MKKLLASFLFLGLFATQAFANEAAVTARGDDIDNPDDCTKILRTTRDSAGDKGQDLNQDPAQPQQNDSSNGTKRD